MLPPCTHYYAGQVAGGRVDTRKNLNFDSPSNINKKLSEHAQALHLKNTIIL